VCCVCACVRSVFFGCVFSMCVGVWYVRVYLCVVFVFVWVFMCVVCFCVLCVMVFVCVVCGVFLFVFCVV